MKGEFPPSSSDTLFTVSAHWAIKRLPTVVDPVKLNLPTAVLEVSSPPISAAAERSPVTTLNTPAGIPARSASTHNASAENGVSSAGFRTIVQPAASAGAALRVTIAQGKFHGVMPAQTPIGSLMAEKRTSRLAPGMISP